MAGITVQQTRYPRTVSTRLRHVRGTHVVEVPEADVLNYWEREGCLDESVLFDVWKSEACGYNLVSVD